MQHLSLGDKNGRIVGSNHGRHAVVSQALHFHQRHLGTGLHLDVQIGLQQSMPLSFRRISQLLYRYDRHDIAWPRTDTFTNRYAIG